MQFEGVLFGEYQVQDNNVNRLRGYVLIPSICFVFVG